MFSDCPNRRDEENCDPEEFFIIKFTVTGLFLLSSSVSAFVFGYGLSKSKKRSSEGDQTETLSPLSEALKALNQQSQVTEGNTGNARNLIEELSEADQFKLITTTHKIKAQDRKALYQEAIASVFKTNEPEKESE